MQNGLYTMSTYYPPVSFYFSLSIAGKEGQFDASFKEVSGIAMEMHVEEVLEGGLNSFQHRVPASTKLSNLVLKRGFLPKDSPLAKWCIDTLEGGLDKPIRAKNIAVSLLNENAEPIRTWTFTNAWPVKWDVSEYNSMNGELLIESLEFAYNYVK